MKRQYFFKVEVFNSVTFVKFKALIEVINFRGPPRMLGKVH